MNWDRFVFNFTGAMYYAILIAWEYIKMGVGFIYKQTMRYLRWANC